MVAITFLNFLDILLLLKTGLFLDAITNAFLCCLIVINGSYCYYPTEKTAKVPKPKIIIIGTLLHIIVFASFQFSAVHSLFATNIVNFIMYMPYFLLSTYIVYSGFLLLRWKAYKTATFFLSHGAVSAVLPVCLWLKLID